MRIWNKGFTLIELLVTLSVAAIVVSIAVPSFNSTIQNNRSVAMGDEAVVALNVARSEAIKRSKRVSICSTTDGATCLTAADWTKGWMVFVDNAISDSASDPIVGEVIRVWLNLPETAVVSLKNATTPITFLRFSGTGMLARKNTADAIARTFSLAITGCSGKAQTVVKIGVSGIVTAAKTNCP